MQVRNFNQIVNNVLGTIEEHYQNHIPLDVWRTLSEWMYDVYRILRTPTGGYVLSLYLLNEVLSRVKIEKMKLQLASICCMHISGMQQEGYPADINDYIYIADKAYTKDEFDVMMKDILFLFEGRIRPPTVYDLILSMQYDNLTENAHDASRMAIILVTYYPEMFA